MPPDIRQLQLFLTILEPNSTLDTPWCWQVVPGRNFTMSMRSALPALTAYNAAGAAIYVTVNETDGQGRKASNITRVRALFIDLDGAPLGPLFGERALHPHVVVETSPKHYHAYWLVHRVLLTDFAPLQKALIAKYGGDPAAAGLSQALRAPGFVNHKRGSMVQLVYEEKYSDLPPYWHLPLRQWLRPKAPRLRKLAPLPRSLPPLVARTLDLLIGLNLYKRDKDNGVHEINCPWASEHPSEPIRAAVYFEPSPLNGFKGGFHCHHAKCRHRTIADLHGHLLAKLEAVS